MSRNKHFIKAINQISKSIKEDEEVGVYDDYQNFSLSMLFSSQKDLDSNSCFQVANRRIDNNEVSTYMFVGVKELIENGITHEEIDKKIQIGLRKRKHKDLKLRLNFIKKENNQEKKPLKPIYNKKSRKLKTKLDAEMLIANLRKKKGEFSFHEFSRAMKMNRENRFGGDKFYKKKLKLLKALNSKNNFNVFYRTEFYDGSYATIPITNKSPKYLLLFAEISHKSKFIKKRLF